MRRVRTYWKRRAGGTLTEYALIISIISIIGVILLTQIGNSTKNLLERTNTNMPQ